MAGPCVPLADAKDFVIRCMTAVGTKTSHAEALAEVLVAADYRGHYSHGLNRIEIYVRDMQSQTCVSDREPILLKESAATAYVDGNNVLGPVVGQFCMDLAIQKAKEAGVGWVVAKGSNHFGIVGWYSMRALAHGMVGLAFTNSSPLMLPTRGKKICMGTNPVSCAAPAQGGDSFVLDMASTTVAFGKIEVQNRKEEPIPYGWAADQNSQITTDAKAALDGALLPLGGSELTSGYKGYGLSMMVEVFCGIMSGSHFGPFVRSWKDTSVEADLGQCFVAIDPNQFCPGFEGRMSELMNACRAVEPTDPSLPVLVPGDPEQEHMKRIDAQGGVDYHLNLINACNQLAESLGVAPLHQLQ